MNSSIRAFLYLCAAAVIAAGCTPVVAQAPTVTPTDCGCSVYGPGGEGTVEAPVPTADEVTPTPLPLEAYQNQWDVYFNDQYGFFFDYPTVYQTEQFGFCKIREQAATNLQEDALLTLKLGSRTSLTVSDPGGRSLEAILLDYQSAPERADMQFGPVEERTVAGQPALSLPSLLTEKDQSHQVTIWLKDNLLYQVEAGSPSACDVTEISLREQDAYQRLLDSFGY